MQKRASSNPSWDVLCYAVCLLRWPEASHGRAPILYPCGLGSPWHQRACVWEGGGWMQSLSSWFLADSLQILADCWHSFANSTPKSNQLEPKKWTDGQPKCINKSMRFEEHVLGIWKIRPPKFFLSPVLVRLVDVGSHFGALDFFGVPKSIIFI